MPALILCLICLKAILPQKADFAPVHDGFVEGLARAVKLSLEKVLQKP